MVSQLPSDREISSSRLSVVQSEVVAALNAYAANGTYIDGFSKVDFAAGSKCWAIDDLQADIARGQSGP